MILLCVLLFRWVAWSQVKGPPASVVDLARPQTRTGGVPLELVTARLGAVFGRCAHRPAVPVDTCLGERVAWLCPTCDQRLPAGWSA